MSSANKPTKPLRATTIILLLVLVCCTGYLIFYYWHINKDYSGHYQADCNEPTCSFELVKVNNDEYILSYLNDDIKMTKYFKQQNNPDTAYLQGSNYANLGPPFSGITFDNLDKDYIQWQGRAYYKQ